MRQLRVLYITNVRKNKRALDQEVLARFDAALKKLDVRTPLL